MMPDGSRYRGALPCMLCRHSRRRKTAAEWRDFCGACVGLDADELEILLWYQEHDSDRTVVAPNILRLSQMHSDERYLAAHAALAERQLARGQRLLDIGCGISAQAEMFRGYRYVGSDLNRPRLNWARAHHPWAFYGVHDITAMGYADASFGVVLCLEVIEHLPPPVRPHLMRELFRVLEPGGWLVLSTPNGRLTPWKHVLGAKCERSHETELTMAEVKTLVADAGGRVDTYETVPNLILPAGRVSAAISHLVARQPRWRQALHRVATKAGYETVLYVAQASGAGSPAVTTAS